ncbi:SusD/RagB family nutrient-binding outer membrane lipoprotein [Agriterribacter sp.]|uniref:SusD/RagB family nutrient-binding outer membrane lipoprotein n=1 Tax=Agriterribacter sp. TaxID=2821509 RepID=UPI002C66AA8F|nr:SusD/RagB family nutrient-binding outer membrane lipoprotein [Agriterribacter sp.]HRO46200.1 SusD/RagB family nutrient-binding outer membrane lipoprotein [Agriterribacter sp.]HRQ16314.1 SusD/RagB family nutrient-binding outer membrane lipoprotein [Agriterribacter sp.]
MKYLKYILPGILLFSLSCTKGYLDVNTDPNNPTEMAEAKLLPNAQKALADNLGFGVDGAGGFSYMLSVYTHQITMREYPDKYGTEGVNLNTAWNNIYTDAIRNCEEIIKSAEESENTIYSGIAKIMNAYAYSQLVDVFGDIPFSESNDYQGGAGFGAPAFDQGKDIYPQLFTLIDEGIADLNNTTAENPNKPGSDDLIYGGNVNAWINAANTIKLKLYNQVRLVQDVSGPVNELLSGGKLIGSTATSFVFPYGTAASPNERSPFFADYYATQRSINISPWFYEIMKGYNMKDINGMTKDFNVFSGIEDPRVPYYFFNQLQPDEGNIEGNQIEYRDGGFSSIVFGSTGPNRDKSHDKSTTVMGIYPAGGRYDDGEGSGGSGVTAGSGTGAAPFRMLTYADRLFIEAELIQAGVVTGGPAAAKDKLKAALNAAIAQVDYVVTKAGTVNQTVPKLAGTDEASDFIDAVVALFESSSADKQMEIILTQKWISNFGGNSVDCYNDYRRTKYPVIFDPNNPEMAPDRFFQPPLTGNIELDQAPLIPVITSRSYPVTLPWSQRELELNKNAPAQKTPASFKVFWMN